MDQYGIINSMGVIVTIEASRYEIADGLAHFYGPHDKEIGSYIIASYNMNFVESITLQKQFTEEEVLKQATSS